MKLIENFVVLEGNAKTHNGVITLKNDIKDEKGSESKFRSEVRSDVNFSNGTIEFKAKFKYEESGCLLLLKNSSNEYIGIGYSKDFKAFALFNNNNTSKVGSLSNFNLKNEILFRMEASGSILKLYVNNVLMINEYVSLIESPITLRLTGDDIKIWDFKYNTKKLSVFIVMQFTPEYNALYSDVIKPVCESYNLECIRADEFYTSTPIIKDIIDSIKNSYIIIAEITPDNPNVFYEIGFAHAINKPTILLCDKTRAKLPFDISGFRTLFYENSIGGKSKIEKDLNMFIESIVK